jgi:hypothetical protein
MLEELENKYSGIIKDATTTINKLLKESNERVEKVEELIEKSIMSDDKTLASSVSYSIINGTFKNMLKANLYVMRANNKYAEVKEYLLFRAKGVVHEAYSDSRDLREGLRGQFLGDVDVLSAIKTIKHQESAFDNFFQEFLTAYQKLKINVSKIDTLELFLNSGIANLNTMIKFTYNIDYLNRELPLEDMSNLDIEDKDVKITFDDDEEVKKTKKRKKRDREKKRL